MKINIVQVEIKLEQLLIFSDKNITLE